MAKILICTGIFPPQVGGPAQYAKELQEAYKRRGDTVRVLTYTIEHQLPILVRHITFFLKVLWAIRGVDCVIALDTLSVGWPAVVAAKLARKNIVIRTGGDFLWESYVERTRDRVLLRHFYATRKNKFNLKERCIFSITRWTLHRATHVVFSTTWQRDIWLPVYGLTTARCSVVENYYGLPRTESFVGSGSSKKIFVAGTRPLVWKNIDRLTEAFALAQKQQPELQLDLTTAPYEQFIEKIKHAYAVILVSLGDISPNMILDAIRAGVPFILTKENGLMNRISDIGVFCDPENPADIAEKILWLADEAHYATHVARVRAFSHTHSWDDIAEEIISTIYERH